NQSGQVCELSSRSSLAMTPIGPGLYAAQELITHGKRTAQPGAFISSRNGRPQTPPRSFLVLPALQSSGLQHWITRDGTLSPIMAGMKWACVKTELYGSGPCMSQRTTKEYCHLNRF